MQRCRTATVAQRHAMTGPHQMAREGLGDGPRPNGSEFHELSNLRLIDDGRHRNKIVSRVIKRRQAGMSASADRCLVRMPYHGLMTIAIV